MTEAEWLACTNSAKMLEFQRRKLTARKLRLFTCAYARQLWHQLTDKRSRQAVVIGERFADRVANRKNLETALANAKAAGRAVQAMGIGHDQWDCYGGWPIAQGQRFHEAVMQEPKIAATRVPSLEDICQGESVIFAAQRVCSKKTDHKWGLYDLFGDDLSGQPLPGVDFPVSW